MTRSMFQEFLVDDEANRKEGRARALKVGFIFINISIQTVNKCLHFPLNSTYPKINADYDVEYLYHAMRSIFKQKVLEDFSKSHLKFLRGTYITKLNIELKLNNKRVFVSVLFQVRASNDKKRVETFREKAISAADIIIMYIELFFE